MKPVPEHFLTSYNTFESNLEEANEHVKNINRWKQEVGRMDLRVQKCMYAEFKRDNTKTRLCSHCFQKMKRKNNMNTYGAKHSMVKGDDIQMAITKFWLDIKMACVSINFFLKHRGTSTQMEPGAGKMYNDMQ